MSTEQLVEFVLRSTVCLVVVGAVVIYFWYKDKNND